MLNHMFLGTNDIDKSRAFYTATFGELGVSGQALPHGTIFVGKDGVPVLVAKPANGEAATASNGFTLGLRAQNYAEVDAWHAAGLAAGGTCEGAPGFRENSPGNMYGAYLRDTDGHKICAFAENTGPKE